MGNNNSVISQEQQHRYAASSSSSSPRKIDLREEYCFPYPEVYDQKDEGTCVAQAISTAMTCAQRSQNINVLDSKFFDAAEIFNEAISLDPQNYRNLRNGITLREGFSTIKSHIRSHHSVEISVKNFKNILANKHIPIILGFALTPEMYSWQETLKKDHYSSSFAAANNKTDYVLPYRHHKHNNDDVNIEGYHCVLIVGYDDDVQSFIIRNSWGKHWGDNGHFYYPYSLIENKKITQDAAIIELWKNNKN